MEPAEGQIHSGEGPLASRGVQNDRSGSPVARFFRGGSVMTRGQNGSGGNCPPTLTRKTRPGFCLQEDGPGVPTPASQISLKSFCPGSLSGPAQGLDRQLHPHRGSVCATSRNPLIAPPSGADGSPFRPISPPPSSGRVYVVAKWPPMGLFILMRGALGVAGACGMGWGSWPRLSWPGALGSRML